MTDPAFSHTVIQFAAAMALLFAAAHDVAVRTVPNLVSLLVAGCGLGLSALDGQLIQALFAGLMVFAAGWFCWRKGWLGGGDVKLLTACVLLVPPAAVPELILCTALAGGVLALFYLMLGRSLRRAPPPEPAAGPTVSGPAVPGPTVSGHIVSGHIVSGHGHLVARVWRAERRRIRRGLSLPYSCAIAAGVLLTLYTPFG